MKKLKLLIIIPLFSSCTNNIIFYHYEGKDNKGKRIELYYIDSDGNYIDNPYSVGDTVQYSTTDHRILNFETGHNKTGIITKIK